jgi:hypothetical protein
MVASWKTTWLRIETSIGFPIQWLDGFFTASPLHRSALQNDRGIPSGALGRARHWPFQYSADSRSAWMVPGWLWWRLPATIHKKKSNGEKCEGLHLVSTRIVFPYLRLSENRVPHGTSNSNGSWIMTIPMKMTSLGLHDSQRNPFADRIFWVNMGKHG